MNDLFDAIMQKSFQNDDVHKFRQSNISYPKWCQDEMTYAERCLTYCVEMFFESGMQSEFPVSKMSLLMLPLKMYNTDAMSEEFEDGFCRFDGVGCEIHIREGFVGIELVAHELAHAIQFLHRRSSDHGAEFNKINLACGGTFYEEPNMDEGEEWKK